MNKLNNFNKLVCNIVFIDIKFKQNKIKSSKHLYYIKKRNCNIFFKLMLFNCEYYEFKKFSFNIEFNHGFIVPFKFSKCIRKC